MSLKRYISYLLVGITLLLNVIPLIPHHHHLNDINTICLLKDAKASDRHASKTHKVPISNDNCPSCYSSNITPVKANDSHGYIHIDFNIVATLCFNEFDFTSPCLILKQKHIPYKQQLKGLCKYSQFGLRAPPAYTLS